MHVAPMAALQQSLLTLHLSPSCEQPWLCEAQTAAPESPADPLQNPPQHSVPDAQPCPSPLQGSSAQKPRMARFFSSWPVRWKTGWLGSTPGLGFWSMAATQSCFTTVLSPVRMLPYVRRLVMTAQK